MEEMSELTVEEAFDVLDAALDVLHASDLAPVGGAEACERIVRLERVGRRVDAAQVALVDGIDRTGAHVADGHASGKVMVRHVANLSSPEAAQRARCAKATRVLPQVREAFAAGRIGVCQVDRIAKFTGPAALAVKLSSTTCYWPGCHVPVTDCQGDHLVPWATGGGSTNPRNGGPACGRHNRLRNHGYRTWRDPGGTFHVTRPDGTEIT